RLHAAGPDHRIALGPADLGDLVGLGSAPDLGAGAPPLLYRLHGARSRGRGRGQGGARRGHPRPGRADQPADRALLRGLVEQPAPGLVPAARRRTGHAGGLSGAAAADGLRLYGRLWRALAGAHPRRGLAAARGGAGDAGGGVMFDFDAGRYALFVWPAYAVTGLVLAVLILDTLLPARRWRRP